MIYPSPTLTLSTGPRRLCPAHTARHVQSQDRAEDRDSHRDPEDHDHQGQAKEREQECDVLPPRDVDALHSQRLGAPTGRQSARLVLARVGDHWRSQWRTRWAAASRCGTCFELRRQLVCQTSCPHPAHPAPRSSFRLTACRSLPARSDISTCTSPSSCDSGCDSSCDSSCDNWGGSCDQGCDWDCDDGCDGCNQYTFSDCDSDCDSGCTSCPTGQYSAAST